MKYLFFLRKNILPLLLLCMVIFIFFCLLFYLLFCLLISRKENFNNNNSKYSHSVDLPLTTTYTCNNMCSSQSKCYITGEQCTSDTDCYGCNIPNKMYEKNNNNKNIRGNNNAGKYSYLVPQYSKITTDIGSQAKIYDIKNKNIGPPPIFFGPFLFNEVANLATKINKDNSSFLWNPKPEDKNFTIKYPKRQTTTGLFLDEGPLASNSYL